jgi:lysyl-tRNA synthetase class 2
LTPELARLRSILLKLTRDFFFDKGFIEADVPLLATDLVPEAEIRPFATKWELPWGRTYPLWLLPSPERYLKQLLAQGFPKLYFLGKVYRNAESYSPHHHPEFSMLEWYEPGCEEDQLIVTLEEFFRVVDAVIPLPPALRPPFTVLDLQDCFIRWVGVDYTQYASFEEWRRATAHFKASERATSWEELWDILFIDKVEPQLPKDRPVILSGWPIQHATQAQVHEINHLKTRRWELYAGGLELVNACKEATDPTYLQSIFQKNLEKVRERSNPPNFSEVYTQFCERLGTVSGAALGFDRFLEILFQKTSIREVIFFPLMDKLPFHE